MIVFEKNEGYGKSKNSKVVRISKNNYEKITTISKRAALSTKDVVDRLLDYAFDRVEWRND